MSTQERILFLTLILDICTLWNDTKWLFLLVIVVIWTSDIIKYSFNLRRIEFLKIGGLQVIPESHFSSPFACFLLTISGCMASLERGIQGRLPFIELTVETKSIFC